MKKNIFRLILTSVMIGVTILTVTIIATMIFNKKGIFNTKEIKIDKTDNKFRNKSIQKPKDKTIEEVNDLKELLYIAINEINSKKYYQTKSYGRTTSVSLFKTFVQEITGNKVVYEDDVFTEVLSKGSYISVARQTFVGLNKNVYLEREGRLETFKNIRWFSIEKVSEEKFLSKYGNTFKEFSQYIFNEETIEKVELLSSDNQFKTIRVFLKIDKNRNDNLSTSRYIKEIKTTSKSSSYPNFLSAFVDVKIDKDFRIIKTTTEEKYMMEKFGNPTCTTIMHQDFSYEKIEIKNRDKFERHFLDNVEGEDSQTPSQLIIKTLLGLYLEKTRFEIEIFNQKFNAELDLRNFDLYLQNENVDIKVDNSALFFRYGSKKYKIPAEILNNNSSGQSGENNGSNNNSGNNGSSINNLISKLSEISKYIDENSKITKENNNYLLKLTIPDLGDVTIIFDVNYQLMEIKLSVFGYDAKLKINKNIKIEKIDFTDAIDLKDKFNLENNFDFIKAFNKIKQMVENKYEINGRYFDQNNELEIVITGNLDITNLYADVNLIVRYKNFTAVIDVMFNNNYIYLKLPTEEGNIVKISKDQIGSLYQKVLELIKKETGNQQTTSTNDLTIVDKIVDIITKITFNKNEFKIESKYLDLIFNFENNLIIFEKIENLNLELTKKESITKLTWNEVNEYLDYKTLDNLIEIIKNTFVKPKNINNQYNVIGNVYELEDNSSKEIYTYTGNIQVKTNNKSQLEELELKIDLLGKEKVIVDPNTSNQTTIEAEKYLIALKLKNNTLYFSYQSNDSNDKFYAKISVSEIENILKLKDKVKELLKLFNIKNSLVNTILGIVDNIPNTVGREQITNSSNEYIVNKIIKSIKQANDNSFNVVVNINYLTNKTNFNNLELNVKGNEIIDKIELLNVYASDKIGFNFKTNSLNKQTNILVDEIFDLYELNGDFTNYPKDPYISPSEIVGDVNKIEITNSSNVSKTHKWKSLIKENKPVPFTFETKLDQIPKLTINGIDSTKLLTREIKIKTSSGIPSASYLYKFELYVRESIVIELEINNVFDLNNTSQLLSQIADYIIGKKYNISGKILAKALFVTVFDIKDIKIQVKFDENNKYYLKMSAEVAYTWSLLAGEFTTGRTLIDLYIKDNIIYVKQKYYHQNKGEGELIHYEITIENFKKDLKKQLYKLFKLNEKTIDGYLPKPNPDPGEGGEQTPGPKFNFSKTIKNLYSYEKEGIKYTFLRFNPYMISGLNSFNDTDLLIFSKENNLSAINLVTTIGSGIGLKINIDLKVENIGQTDFELNMPDFTTNWWE